MRVQQHHSIPSRIQHLREVIRRTRCAQIASSVHSLHWQRMLIATEARPASAHSCAISLIFSRSASVLCVELLRSTVGFSILAASTGVAPHFAHHRSRHTHALQLAAHTHRSSSTHRDRALSRRAAHVARSRIPEPCNRASNRSSFLRYFSILRGAFVQHTDIQALPSPCAGTYIISRAAVRAAAHTPITAF